MTEVKGELTAELALKLTFIMWEDMAEEEKRIGRNLDEYERHEFKANWLEDRGFVDRYGMCNVCGWCLLCEYTRAKECGCRHCLIDWSKNSTNSCWSPYGPAGIDYEYTPTDKFLEYMKTHVRKDVN